MKPLQDKTFLITGASRGIGKAIALKLASEGANIVIASKSIQEDPRLGGTIYSAAAEIEALGVQALAVPCDIRDDAQILNVVQETEKKFGVLHGLINNASAISLTPTTATTAKRFDLMHQINVRGTFLLTSHCIQLLAKANGSNIITLSPPIQLVAKWLAPFAAYTISKFNMSMMTMAWGEELKPQQIAATSLWPATTIATAAVKNLLGGEALIAASRKPDIVADAALSIIQKGNFYNGQCVIDEAVLQADGITDFSSYAVGDPNKLQKDLFL